MALLVSHGGVVVAYEEGYRGGWRGGLGIGGGVTLLGQRLLFVVLLDSPQEANFCRHIFPSESRLWFCVVILARLGDPTERLGGAVVC